MPAMKTRFKAIFILSVMIPTTLLTSLKLGGFLDVPATIAETKTLNMVNWESPRPTRHRDIYDVLEAPYVNDGLSATFSIVIGYYSESPSRNDNDYLRMQVKIDSIALESTAFIEGVSIVFHPDCQPSFIEWLYTYIRFENLSLLGVSSGWTFGEEFKEPRIRLLGTNHPHNVSFSGTVEWSLLTPNNQTHQMEITYELMYYNGTVYKKIIQPFQLKLYTSYHYLNVDAGILNIGETSVMIFVDDAVYYAPFEIIVSEGAHRIEFEPFIMINSTTYDFDFWGAQYGSPQKILGSSETYNVTLNITRDTHLRAFYRVV